MTTGESNCLSYCSVIHYASYSSADNCCKNPPGEVLLHGELMDKVELFHFMTMFGVFIQENVSFTPKTSCWQ
jgi:hypothetical protein